MRPDLRRVRWSLRPSRSHSRSPRGALLAGSRRSSLAFTADRIETALLVAVPVLLGSLARLPMGMLTDRFGGRARLHGAPRLLVAGRLHCSADQQLRSLVGRGVPDRHGRVVLRSWRGVRIPLDPGCSPGHGPRRLRLGDDGPVAGCLRRPGGRGPFGWEVVFRAPARCSLVGRPPTSCSRVIRRTPLVRPRSPR